VPKHGSVSIFVGVVVVAAIMGSLAAHIVMYRTRTNESARIFALENKVIEYQERFAKMLGSSVGLHSLPGDVRLVTWTTPSYRLSSTGVLTARVVHSRVSEWLHGPYRLSSIELNRVLTAK
jgi:hypothetical protein